jgi:hypothetical protein
MRVSVVYERPAAVRSLAKFGVPRPVICVCIEHRALVLYTAKLTGSQPVRAANPLVEQPELEPEVTSLSADAAVLYNQGLRKPNGDLPAVRSWSLSSAERE